MATESQKTVLVIGGTGAQGVPVVQALAADEKYAVRVLTRNPESAAARQLSALPGVTIVQGDPYDEPTLRAAFAGADCAFVNTNGFAIGQAKEIHWGIRMYELAAGAGVRHFVWAGLAYASRLGRFDARYEVGHANGKAKVAQFLAAQPTAPMAWSVLNSAMYMETLSEMLAPRPDPLGSGALVFSAPLGQGRPPLIYLRDLGRYARWIFDTPERSAGMTLQVSTEDVGWEYLARTFTEVTGRKAVYRDITLDEYFAPGFVFEDAEAKVGHSVDHDSTFVTYRQNFTGFWNTWKDNLLKTDYALLDEILPDRVKTLGEWMRLTGYDGSKASVLKDYADGRKVRR